MAEYYVRSTGGSDGNTGLSFAQGWATLAYAFSNSTTSDTLYVCATDANPFSLSTAFTVTSGRQFIGCDLTDGSPYNGTGKARIEQTGFFQNTVTTTTANNNTLWQDICFDGNGQYGQSFEMTGPSQIYNYMFRGCDFIDSTYDGVKINTSSTLGVVHYGLCFHNCNIYDNGYYGINIVNNSTQAPHVLMSNCTVRDNYSTNIYLAPPAAILLFNCRIFGSGSRGVDFGHNDSQANIQHSIIALNSSDGIRVNNGGTFRPLTVFNSIIAHNGGYGITNWTASGASWEGASHNCFYNNTSGNLSPYMNGGVLPGYGNVTTDPQFTSIVSGSEDFTLQSSSPCINAGYGYEGGQ